MATFTTRFRTLSVLPGASENSTYTTESGEPPWLRKGDPFQSAVPFYFPNIDIDFRDPIFNVSLFRARTTPVLENWLTGDMVTSSSLPDYSTASATATDKYEERNRTDGPKWTLRSGVDVTVSTTSSGGIDLANSTVTTNGTSSASYIEQESVNNIKGDLDTVDGSNDGVFAGGYRPRYISNKQKVTINGVETLRVSTIFGGYTRVAQRAKEVIAARGIVYFLEQVLGWNFNVFGLDTSLQTKISLIESIFGNPLAASLFAVPNIYTFQDLFVTANGAKYVRIWDASSFPQHYSYIESTIGGVRRTNRRYISPLSFAFNEQVNLAFTYFLLEAAARTTPYYSPRTAYLDRIKSEAAGNDPPNATDIQTRFNNLITLLPGVSNTFTSYRNFAASVPLAVFGEDPNGNALSSSTVKPLLPTTVLDPFTNSKAEGPS